MVRKTLTTYTSGSCRTPVAAGEDGLRSRARAAGPPRRAARRASVGPRPSPAVRGAAACRTRTGEGAAWFGQPFEAPKLTTEYASRRPAPVFCSRKYLRPLGRSPTTIGQVRPAAAPAPSYAPSVWRGGGAASSSCWRSWSWWSRRACPGPHATVSADGETAGTCPVPPSGRACPGRWRGNRIPPPGPRRTPGRDR